MTRIFSYGMGFFPTNSPIPKIVFVTFLASVLFLCSGEDGSFAATDVPFEKKQEPMVEQSGETGQGTLFGSVDFADIDSDGDADLAISGEDVDGQRRLLVYENTGSGEFVEKTELDTGLWYSSIKFADVDNDGDPDLAASGADKNDTAQLLIFHNNGSGQFSVPGDSAVGRPMVANTTETGVKKGSIDFADVDSDGDLDLGITGKTNAGNDTFIILHNDGSGSFTLQPDTSVSSPMGPGNGVSESSITFADLDGDGNQDLAVTGSREFKIFENDGSGSFVLAQDPMSGIGDGVRRGSVSAADIDKDADTDLVVTGQDKDGVNRFIIFENNGISSFDTSAEPLTENSNPNDTGLVQSSSEFTDIDGDGDPDLIVAGSSPGIIGSDRRFIVYQNNGSGTFAKWSAPFGEFDGFWKTDLAVANYDNDLDPDLVISGEDSSGEPRLLTYENNTTLNNQVTSRSFHSDTSIKVSVDASNEVSFHQITFQDIPDSNVSELPLVPKADTTVNDANYSIKVPLLESGRDTVTIFLWTNQLPVSLAVGIRSDTTDLDTENLPGSITPDDTGLDALGRSAVLVEFSDSENRMLGDTVSTTDISDSYAYTLKYNLSPELTDRFAALEFDTGTGSTDFHFYIADYYEDIWREETSSNIFVKNTNDSISVTIPGLHKDLPGGLGREALIRSSDQGCIVENLFENPNVLEVTRQLRDWGLQTRIGRILTISYYSWNRVVQ